MGIKNRALRRFFPEPAVGFAVKRYPTSTGIVLMYHEVLPDEVDVPAWVVVKESDFRWQMETLGLHFDVVSMTEALSRAEGRRVSERPFAVVTFDDGYRGGLKHVLPIMESLGLPFVHYVATNPIMTGQPHWFDSVINLLQIKEPIKVRFLAGGKEECHSLHGGSGAGSWLTVQDLLTRLKELPDQEREKAVTRIREDFFIDGSFLAIMSPEELKQLARSNCVEIGSHTHRHELLDTIPAGRVNETLRESKRILEGLLDRPIEHFSYPNGNFNAEVARLVGDAGFQSAVTGCQGLWWSWCDTLTIPRCGVGRFETRSQFRARISGMLL